MRFLRSGGILLHPTSLPGPGGIGSLGAEAREFARTLSDALMGLWQVLPLGPTGYADSPYQGLSAFAGNPLLIDLESLVGQGLLLRSELESLPYFPETHVDYGSVAPTKMKLLHTAYERFTKQELPDIFRSFVEENRDWLDEFSLYVALKDAHGLKSWTDWETPYRDRHPDALNSARRSLAGAIGFHHWLQYTFFSQWQHLKSFANERGVRIVGDIPIFVAYDSADVWSQRELFQLDEHGVPEIVAGVPPDYFSATGQLWGNPHYRWDVMRSTGFDWWIRRFKTLQRLVDIVRLDHFRGFAGAWAVPYGEATAVRGEWVDAPGQELFEAVETALGELPIIAEDLGVITPDVVALRTHFNLPGMKILQFAFSTDASDPGLPHNYERDTVVYTGTHDNDTTVGWFSKASPKEREHVRRYIGTQAVDVSWDLMRLAFASVACIAIVPLQDVMRLGKSARMNLPGTTEGNWTWRFVRGDLNQSHVENLANMSEVFGRANRLAVPERAQE